jgi:azurin
MYQPWLASIVIAAAPIVALAQTPPATQKPAPPAAQTPATAKPGTPAKPDAAQQGASKGGRLVEIIGTDDMKFSVVSINAKPGEQIRVRLIAKGGMPKIAMAHNFVLLAKAADTLKFVNASAMARATDFVPAEFKAQILASTGLAGAGEAVEVSFKAPTVPGAYTYLCSFPGHFQAGMKGTLTVK